MSKTLAAFALFFTNWFMATAAQAVCPVCTVAVGAGLGLSRFLGIDDAISGLWIGGLLMSTSLWTVNWLTKRTSLNLKILTAITVAAFYLLVLVPLMVSETIGHPFNTIWGIDKLLFGTALGTALFIGAVKVDQLARQSFGGQFFIYQKVAFPVVSLMVASVILYLTIR